MLKDNIAGTVIISDDINMSRIEKICKRCSNIEEELIEQGKKNCKKNRNEKSSVFQM